MATVQQSQGFNALLTCLLPPPPSLQTAIQAEGFRSLRENEPARLEGDEPVLTALREVAPSRVAAAATQAENEALAYAGADTPADPVAIPGATAAEGADVAGAVP